MFMKKIASSLLITACCLLSCEEPRFRYSERVERMRINFFVGASSFPNPVLAPNFQIGKMIGTEDWHPLITKINRFEYKPGFIYDLLVVRKIEPTLGVPYTDFKLVKIMSIKKVDKNRPFVTNLKRENQYYVTGDIHKGYKLLDKIDIDCNSNCFQLENALKTNKFLKGNFVYNDDGSIKLLDLVVEQ